MLDELFDFTAEDIEDPEESTRDIIQQRILKKISHSGALDLQRLSKFLADFTVDINKLSNEASTILAQNTGLADKIHLTTGFEPKKRSFPKNIKLSPEGIISSANFYPPESDGRGQYYRWSGSEELSSFYLGIDRSVELQGELSLNHFKVPEDKKAVKIFIDDENVRFEQDEHGKILFKISERKEVKETKISILAPQVHRASIQDDRMICFTLNEVRVYPVDRKKY